MTHPTVGTESTRTPPRQVPALVLPAQPCDACGVPHAKSRFASGASTGVLDLCGHHATRHRTALILSGWSEYALAQPDELPPGVSA